MKYVAYHPGCSETQHWLERVEANSKEEAVEAVRRRIKNARRQNDNYRSYESRFKFSRGKKLVKPELVRTGDEKQDKIALKKHVELCQQFHENDTLYWEEFKEYMAKCPYVHDPVLWAKEHLPTVKDIYEYPEEFWNVYLAKAYK